MTFLQCILGLFGIVNEDKVFLADCLEEEARQDGYRDPRYEWLSKTEVKRDSHNMPVKKGRPK